MWPSGPLTAHYAIVVKAILDGRVVPFLGAGANLCGRPQGFAWHPEQTQHLPSGQELASHLAKQYGYPANEHADLVRVSQYVSVTSGQGPLYEELHKLFDAGYPATPLHTLLAVLPALFRAKGLPPQYQLIITTNYDDVMERAFAAAGEPFHVVTYIAEGKNRGKFCHRLLDGTERIVDKPNKYVGVSPEKASVILKMHGAVDRVGDPREERQDSFVITEDDYIEYLSQTDISNLIPVTLRMRMLRSNFLFLGYGLRDWNLRALLHRIWGEQKLGYASWAVQRDPEELEEKFWMRRAVEIINVSLEEYIVQLRTRLDGVAAARGASVQGDATHA